MKVCVLGASGFVGTHLARALAERGDEVVAASLRDPAAAAAVAARCDAVVNLAGAPIAQRWTQSVKQAILQSRTELPCRLLQALVRERACARIYVSASAVGYYGTSESKTFVEEDAPGTDFLARVCQAWERSALAAREFGMRAAVVRTGLALGRGGGALAKILPPFRVGLGAVAGTGRQWCSWIHVDDLTGIYLSVLDRGEGAYNATAPTPVTNAEFVRTLGAVLHRPTVVPASAFALGLILGEGASVLTSGQRVLPRRIVAEGGYAFRFDGIAEALRASL